MLITNETFITKEELKKMLEKDFVIIDFESVMGRTKENLKKWKESKQKNMVLKYVDQFTGHLFPICCSILVKNKNKTKNYFYYFFKEDENLNFKEFLNFIFKKYNNENVIVWVGDLEKSIINYLIKYNTGNRTILKNFNNKIIDIEKIIRRMKFFTNDDSKKIGLATAISKIENNEIEKEEKQKNKDVIREELFKTFKANFYVEKEIKKELKKYNQQEVKDILKVINFLLEKHL